MYDSSVLVEIRGDTQSSDKTYNKGSNPFDTTNLTQNTQTKIQCENEQCLVRFLITYTVLAKLVDAIGGCY